MRLISTKDGAGIFRRDDGGPDRREPERKAKKIDLSEVQACFVSELTPQLLDKLASTLWVTTESLTDLCVGWASRKRLRKLGASGRGWTEKYPDGAYSFPERDGAGRIIGFSFRLADGRKGSPSSEVGCARGLVVSAKMSALPDPVLIVEGASDVAACTVLGLAAVGRPSNFGGGEPLARALRGRRVLVVGERDQKPDGSWPGRDGAVNVASALANAWELPIRWSLPPASVKDVRAYLNGMVASGLDLRDSKVTSECGATLLAEMLTTAQVARPSKQSQRAAPPPMAAAAYHGLAGEFAIALDPYTEADRVAVLTQILVMFGNAIGRSAFFLVEDTKHYMNLNLVLVGDSSKGRKGTSFARVKRLFELVAEDWVKTCIVKGLSSGEGLIHQVRDGEELGPDGDESNGDPGAKDKRAMVVEAEFAQVLRVSRREGNTLSTVLRDAWDTGDLKIMIKNFGETATGAHISLIGHITGAELFKEWNSLDSANGLGNRFLWAYTQRSKLLPNGSRVPEGIMSDFAARLGAALGSANLTREMVRDADAERLWAELYVQMSTSAPGVTGAMTARAEAQVLRISCVYALLDCSSVVRVEHLRAAKAVYDYVVETVRFVFGTSLGDPIADEILRMLREKPEGMSRTEIRDAFNKNVKAELIGPALHKLAIHGLARREMVPTGGRSAERWFAIAPADPADDPGISSAANASDLWSFPSSMSYTDCGESNRNASASAERRSTEITTETTEDPKRSDDTTIPSFPSSMSYSADVSVEDGGIQAEDTCNVADFTTETTEVEDRACRTHDSKDDDVEYGTAVDGSPVTTKTTETTEAGPADDAHERGATTETTETTEGVDAGRTQIDERATTKTTETTKGNTGGRRSPRARGAKPSGGTLFDNTEAWS